MYTKWRRMRGRAMLGKRREAATYKKPENERHFWWRRNTGGSWRTEKRQKGHGKRGGEGEGKGGEGRSDAWGERKLRMRAHSGRTEGDEGKIGWETGGKRRRTRLGRKGIRDQIEGKYTLGGIDENIRIGKNLGKTTTAEQVRKRDDIEGEERFKGRWMKFFFLILNLFYVAWYYLKIIYLLLLFV